MAYQSTAPGFQHPNIPAVAPPVLLSLYVLHPDNGQAITALNPVPLAQVGQLSMRNNLNPFPFIRESASEEAKAAIMHMANAEGAKPRHIFDVNPPHPVPVEPQGEYADNVLLDHYKWVAQVEVANQLHLLPYIITIHPSQVDKSYTAVMIASFRRWIGRVKLFDIQAAAHKDIPSIVDVRGKIAEQPNNPQDLSYAWRQLWDATGVMIQQETRDNLKDRFAAAETDIEKFLLQTSYLCRILKEWTVAWEQERAMLEKAWFQQAGNVPQTAVGAPPYGHVIPRKG